MGGIFLAGLSGAPYFAESLQSTKERLKKNLEAWMEGLEEPSADNLQAQPNLSKGLIGDIENLRREINVAEFQISKLHIAEQSIDYLEGKLEQLKGMAADASDSTAEAANSAEQVERKASELVESFNLAIDTTLFAGHELLNGGDGSVVTIDYIDGVSMSTSQSARDSLKQIEKKAEELKSVRKELETLRTDQLQSEVATLQVTMQNISALQASARDVEDAATKSEILGEQLKLQAGSALTAQGNLASSSVLQLIS